MQNVIKLQKNVVKFHIQFSGAFLLLRNQAAISKEGKIQMQPVTYRSYFVEFDYHN